MALRLELKQKQGPEGDRGSRRWQLERGRRTIGRSDDCDWQIEDKSRIVSKVHCTIESVRDGFVLRDDSTNGSRVDGRALYEGESARLRHGSLVEVGSYVFEALISGETEPDLGDPDGDLSLGDESLTISSILADVAPASSPSHGLKGPDDAWRDLPSRDAGAAPTSRRVDIGWRGPPEPGRVTPVLPDNWYEDSDYSSQLEHASATRISVPSVRNAAAGAEPPAEEANETDAVFVVQSEPAPEPVPVSVPPVEAPAAVTKDVALPALEALAARCEEACSEVFAAFDIDLDKVVPAPDAFGLSREEALQKRLETVLAAQRALGTALHGMLVEASHALEPRIVEARTDAEPRKIPWLRDRTYWQAYKANFDRNGNVVSVRDLFREAMLRSLGTDAARREEGVDRPK